MNHRTLWTLVLALFVVATTTAARADDFDTARDNRFRILAGPATFNTADPSISGQLSDIAANASAWQSKIDSSPTRVRFFTDVDVASSDVNVRSAAMTKTFSRLRDMALAYATYGSSLNGNSTLLAQTIDGLDWTTANIYTATATKTGNWWDWEIGSPLSMNDAIVLIYAQLTSAQITTYTASTLHYTFNLNCNGGGACTGANLMWKAEILGLTGVLKKTGSYILTATNASTGAPKVLNTVTSSDGYYADNSFIQHDYFAYTGAYGLSLIADMVDFINVYAGTTYALSTTTTNLAVSRLLKSYKPLVYKGEMMDDVRGREISRITSTSHGAGRKILGTYLHAIPVAAVADAPTLKSAAKYWLNVDTTFSPSSDGFDIRTTLQAEALIADSATTPMTEPTGFNLFSSMDRIVFLRPGWGAGLSMFSNRRANYEAINSENKKGWHTASGMLYLYDGDLNQHSLDYWPTIDNFRLEGTTVQASSGETSGSRSDQAFVGGVPSYDGVYGIGAMSLKTPNAALTGKKAWFFLDNQIFALGANITATGTPAIETIIANRKLTDAGTNTITTNLGASSSAPVAETTTLTPSTGVSYLHIAGNVTGSDVGFFFPTPVTLGTIRSQRTHAWSEINQNPNYAGYTTLVTRNYFTAAINHGTTPTGATYAYAELPLITAANLAAYAASPDVTILENTAVAQAISDPKLGATAAIFWDASNHTVGSGNNAITASLPSAVFVTQSGGVLTIAVSDPSKASTGTIHISLNRSAISRIDTGGGVVAGSDLSTTIELDIALPISGGVAKASFSINDAVVTVDNASNTGGSTVTITGAWTASTGSAGYYGADYLHDGNTGKGSKSVTFVPNIPLTGRYEVQARWTTSTNRATNTPLKVNSADPQAAFTVNQTTNGGTWVSFGTYNFTAGTTGNVQISNTATNGYVVADAVRFIAR